MPPTAPSDPDPQPPTQSSGTDNPNPNLQTFDHSRWIRLVELVQSNEQAGLEELYKLFLRGVRFYLCRQLGPQELDDKIHDAFLVVVNAIRRGELREPARLPGYIRTIVRRQVAAQIDVAVQTRRDQADMENGYSIPDRASNPEEAAIQEQRAAIMRQVLDEISERDREILTRFYIQEQPQEVICDEMGLSETQFRLLKSRAKTRFGELGRRKLVRKAMGRFFRQSA
ncbi:MAG: sigma-70 family RNA polymerase sigma factor [Bryobacterales bacterium]|nr:sigma-70 family RNA polymerase sigma factor [Bryobacterales bacterium]